MAKLKEIETIANYLSQIKNIEGIENIEITNISEDVDADIGIKIRLKKGYPRQEVLNQLNDIEWELYEREGELLSVYKEFT